ncbi:hypothetical protein HmCmsJML138_00945 [Escherichia coli]|nr:hypothetical protein HmCmsJML138_00945 [Escherichia coli]GDE42261.1 hypothetical protein HmCmsJML283_04318 [Escherichia coli]STM87053.1 Uncharacterised protein [Escherichia coli]
MTFRLFKLEIRCTSATVESISKTSPGKTVVLATLPKSARILRSISFFVFFLFIEKSLVKSFLFQYENCFKEGTYGALFSRFAVLISSLKYKSICLSNVFFIVSPLTL